MRPGVLLLLAVLALHGSPAHAARGNSLRDHVLHGFEPPAEAALPAWQPLVNYDESMDAARRLLAEYALNAADDYILPEHEGDETTKVRLLLEQYALATAEEDYPEADANANDYEESMDAARRLLQDSAPSAAEEYVHPQHEGDAITLARLMLEQYGTEAAADDSFLADAIATVKNLDETHSQQAAELQAPVPDEPNTLSIDPQSPPAPPGSSSMLEQRAPEQDAANDAPGSSSMLEQKAPEQDAAKALVPPAAAPAPYLDHPVPQTPGAESCIQQAAALLQASAPDELQDGLQLPPAPPAPGSSSVLEQQASKQGAATAQTPPAEAPAPYLDNPLPQTPGAESHSQQAAAELQAPAPDELQGDLQLPPAPGGSSVLEQQAVEQDTATALVPPADAPAPYLDHPLPQTPGAETHSQQAAAEVQAPVADELPDDVLSHQPHRHQAAAACWTMMPMHRMQLQRRPRQQMRLHHTAITQHRRRQQQRRHHQTAVSQHQICQHQRRLPSTTTTQPYKPCAGCWRSTS